MDENQWRNEYVALDAPPTVQTSQQPSPELKPKRRIPWKWIAILLAALIALGMGLLLLRNFVGKRGISNQQPSQIQSQEVDLGSFANVATPLKLDSTDKVVINGQLQTTQGILLTASTQPAAAIFGQVYLDAVTKEIKYYNGTAFVALATTDQNTLTQAEVLALINGNQTELPQDLATTASPLFAGLRLSGSNGNAALLQAAAGTANLTFTLPANTGSINQCLTTDGNGTLSFAACASGSGNAFLQGGNAFATTGTLGTTDANALNLITNNTTRLSISATGNIGIGNTSPVNKLAVNTPTTADTGAQTIIATGAAANKGLVIQGVIFQTGNMLEIQDYNATSLFSVSADGITAIRTASNSVTGFQVQNASGTAVLSVDTSNQRVGISNSTPSYKLDVGGDVNIAGASALRIGGTVICTSAGCDSTGSSGFYIQNSTGIQSNANFAIQSANAGYVGGVIRGAPSQTANLLNLQISSGANVVSVGATGNALFQPSTNSTTAFQVQNAAGSSNTLIADTSNNRVGIGIAPSYKLDVNGDVNIEAASALRFGGTIVCTASGCNTGSGSGFYIQNGTGVQSNANFAIQSANASYVGGLIRGAASQTADLLQLQNSSSTNLFTISATGIATFQNSTNSTGALLVKNAAGDTNVLVVDTTNNRLGINAYPSGYALHVNGDTNLDNSGTYRINGTIVCSISGCLASGGSGNYIQNGNGVQTNANFAIQSANVGYVGGLIRGAASQSADIFQVQNSSASNLFKVNPTGVATFQNSADSTAAFLVNNAAGTTILSVNTTSGIVAATNTGGNAIVGTTSNSSSYGVVGTQSAGVGGGVQGVGGGGYGILGQSASNASAFFQTTDTSNLNTVATLITKAQTNQVTADLLQAQTSAGAVLFGVGATGAVLSKNSTNSTAAFQVQNAAGTGVLVVDTTNTRVGIGGTPTEMLNLRTNSSAIIRIDADLDNVTETDHPGIIFAQDGGNVTGFLGIEGGTNDITLEGQTAFSALILGTSNATRLNISATGAAVYTGGTAGDAFTINNSTSTGSVLALQDNGTAVLTVADGGAVTAKNSVNSTAAFLIQNAASAALFTVDTTNTQIKTETLIAQTAGALTTSVYSATLDSTSNTGAQTSIALDGNDLARIAYFYSSSSDLRHIRCLNAQCTSRVQTNVVTTNVVGKSPSIAVGSDTYSRIAYNDNTSNQVKFLKCNNLDCTSTTTPAVIGANSADPDANSGRLIDLKIGSDGFPRIVYVDGAVGDDLHFVRCTAADCSTLVDTTVEATALTFRFLTMTLGSDGYGRIAYKQTGTPLLRFAQCTNNDCSTSSQTTIDSTNTPGNYNSIVMGSDGFARITHVKQATNALEFVQCTNASCSTKNQNTVDTTNAYQFTSVAMATDNRARIAYYDNTAGKLKYATCGNAACSSASLVDVDAPASTDVGQWTSMALTSSNSAQISYRDTTNNDLKFANTSSASDSYTGSSIGSASTYYSQIFVKNVRTERFLLQPTIDSVTSFQVANSAGTTILDVDTINGYVGIGTITPSGLLTIGGSAADDSTGDGTDAPASLKVLAIKGGNTTGTTGQVAGDGSSITLQGGAGGDAPSGSTNGNGGNITLQAGAAGSGAGTAGTAGSVIVRNGANSTTAFQVQNAASTTVLNVDTSNSRVGIGNTTPGNSLSVNAATTADSLAQTLIGTGATTNKGLVVQGVSSQTGALIQAQDSTGTVLLSVDAGGRVLGPNGAVGNASFSFFSDNNTGMYRIAEDNIGWTIGGAAELSLTSTVLGATTAEGLDLGSSSVEFNQLFLGDDEGIKFGLAQEAVLAYDQTTDDRLEITGSNGSLFIEDKLGLGAQSLTVTDDGTANDTLTATASYVKITVDATGNGGTPDLVLSETGAKDGDVIVIVSQNGSADSFTITESSGVVHVPGASVTIGANSSITLIYSTDRWITLAQASN